MVVANSRGAGILVIAAVLVVLTPGASSLSAEHQVQPVPHIPAPRNGVIVASTIVLGHFADGAVVDITESRNVTYTSSDSAIATVSGSGMVTAVAPGTATITVHYGRPSTKLRSTIAVIVPLPFGLPPVIDLTADLGSQLKTSKPSAHTSTQRLDVPGLEILACTDRND